MDRKNDLEDRINTWCSESGTINKLRTQLRHSLITFLKDNSNSNKNTIITTSPEDNAIELLIAEFLICKEHFYTVSIFMNEVPLLKQVQEFSTYVNYCGNNITSESNIKFKFQFNDVKNILELLDIQLNTDILTLTCQYYFNSEENKMFSLLTCLFKALITINNDPRNHQIINNTHEATMYKEHKNTTQQNNEIVEKVSVINQNLASNFHSSNTSLLFEEKEKSRNEKLKDINIQNNKLVLKDIIIFKLEKKLNNKEIKIQLLKDKNIDLVKQLNIIKSKQIDTLSVTEMVKNLQKDNDELRELVKVLKQRNEELSNRIIQIKENQQIPITTGYEANNVKKSHYLSNQNINYSTSSTTDESNIALEWNSDSEEDEVIKEAYSKLIDLELKSKKLSEIFNQGRE